MRRILIATEGSACSMEAIRHFVDTLGAGPAEVFALSVIAPITGFHTTDQAVDELEAAMVAADQALDEAQAALAPGGSRVRTMRRIGAPAATIVQVAKDVGADLIVLGTHGPGALARLAGGSVAEAVLHDAPCGVVIYPWPARTPAVTAG